MSHCASTQELTLGELLPSVMRYQMLLRQEVRLSPHEVQAVFRKTIRAVIALGVGLGTASTGGWHFILMRVHLFRALMVLPP
jgi:hypothetical protein